MEHTISTKELKGKLDRNESIKVVETLAPERYREAHIPGALNIPPDKIKELAPQVLPNKNAEIVTYCTNTHPMKEDVKKKIFSPPLGEMRVW